MIRTYLLTFIGIVVLLAGCGSGTLDAPLETQVGPAVLILLHVPPQATAELDLFTSHIQVPGPASDRVDNIHPVNGHALALKDGRVKVKFNLTPDSMEADCERGVLTLWMADTITKEAYVVRVRRASEYDMRAQGRRGGGPNTDTPDCLIWDVGGAGVQLRFEAMGRLELTHVCQGGG